MKLKAVTNTFSFQKGSVQTLLAQVSTKTLAALLQAMILGGMFPGPEVLYF